MIVVSDSSALISLAAIERLHLLRDLYGRVLIPEAVYAEVTRQPFERPGAQEVTEAEWIEVRAVQNWTLARVYQIGRGEGEAIALAVEARPARIIIDEHRARAYAQGLGLRVIGVLGVLLEAKSAGLIPLVKPEIDNLLVIAGSRIAPRLYASILAQAGEDP